ncbi:MAG: methylenetetrahydrofolate reductase [Bacteroidales bacterium]|nr:methylenetetrahydrofolate reductase [NAD(P)H] [Bacteroidales bacterium]
MKVSDILAESTKAFPSLEIVPPLRGMTKHELLESIAPFMEFSPKYINVTSHRDEHEYRQEADGTFSRHLVRNRISETTVCAAIMSRYDVDVVPHLICGGSTSEEIESKLDNLEFLGINNIVALRGDCITGEKRFTPTPGGYRYASELVEGIRKYQGSANYRRRLKDSSTSLGMTDRALGMTDRALGMTNGKTEERYFCIGVGGYPEKHFEAPNIETDIVNLKKKVDAGADYIITQMFFDNKVYYDFVDRCRAAGITVPIIPGLKPLSTVRQIGTLPEAFSLDIPLELTEAMKDAGDDRKAAYRIGTEWCTMQCKDLIAHGVPAVHFYTMGKSENIVKILQECF